jgi:hypothetical protein
MKLFFVHDFVAGFEIIGTRDTGATSSSITSRSSKLDCDWMTSGTMALNSSPNRQPGKVARVGGPYGIP